MQLHTHTSQLDTFYGNWTCLDMQLDIPVTIVPTPLQDINVHAEPAGTQRLGTQRLNLKNYVTLPEACLGHAR
jgi:hypothetical protein